MTLPYLALVEAPPDLLGAVEARELLGISESRLRQLREREDFPPPALVLRSGPVWYRADLDLWAEANAERRAKHDPRKNR